MSHDPNFHPHVYPTGDGERSTAGSNYGDWRPAQPQRPHRNDFEARFQRTGRAIPDTVARDPDGLQTRYKRFTDDFGRWREQLGTNTTADTEADPAAKR